MTFVAVVTETSQALPSDTKRADDSIIISGDVQDAQAVQIPVKRVIEKETAGHICTVA